MGKSWGSWLFKTCPRVQGATWKKARRVLVSIPFLGLDNIFICVNSIQHPYVELIRQDGACFDASLADSPLTLLAEPCMSPVPCCSVQLVPDIMLNR